MSFDRKTVRELLPVLQAYANGETIQVNLGDDCGGWIDFGDDEIPKFDSKPSDYRVKPKPKYRPFKDAEECWQEMQKHHPFGWVKDCQGFAKIESVWTDSDPSPERDSDLYINIFAEEGDHPADVFKEYTFVDGTPFGVEVME